METTTETPSEPIPEIEMVPDTEPVKAPVKKAATPKKAPVKKPEKKTEKKQPRARIAHCLACDGEWLAKNGFAAKPSKCPTCKSTRAVWKDQMPKEDIEVENMTELEPVKEKKIRAPVEECDDYDYEDDDEEEYLPETRKGSGVKALLFLAGAVVIVGGIIVAVRRWRRLSRTTQRTAAEDDEAQGGEPMPKLFGGNF